MDSERRQGLSKREAAAFRKRLAEWYRACARELPWRGISDPYRTWVSEVMLQQTRVAAVLDHYERFLRLFPSMVALALASENDVLAAWSGLGYYRRARMLHKAARFVVQELDGTFPSTSEGLRTLPGIGEYTCAAIASIAFGESIAVVDGNVERVLLRVTGRPEDKTAAGRRFVREQAELLVPEKKAGGLENAAGDHNQAMMELGATICVPKAPLCLQCPVYELCRTRGEHLTGTRGRQRSRPAAFLLETRKHGATTEVLLERRSAAASLMPGMMELPALPLDSTAGREPILTVRHSITNTNYYVSVYAESDGNLKRQVPAQAKMLTWCPVQRLGEQPLTGLARKILKRVNLMSVVGLETPERRKLREAKREEGRGKKAGAGESPG